MIRRILWMLPAPFHQLYRRLGWTLVGRYDGITGKLVDKTRRPDAVYFVRNAMYDKWSGLKHDRR